MFGEVFGEHLTIRNSDKQRLFVHFGEVLDKIRTKLLGRCETCSDKHNRLFDIIELIEATVAHRF